MKRRRLERRRGEDDIALPEGAFHDVAGLLRVRRRFDPPYRARRVHLTGEEKLDEPGSRRRTSLIELGDPNAEVALAYRVKKRIRDFYRTLDSHLSRAILDDLKGYCLRREIPPKV